MVLSKYNGGFVVQADGKYSNKIKCRCGSRILRMANPFGALLFDSVIG